MSQAERKRRQAQASEANFRQPLPPVSEPVAWGIAAATTLAVLLVYARTLHPSVPGGDSGELILVALVKGVAHPPGYPLHTLLARIFAALPWGQAHHVGQRVNFLSAVCGALSAGLCVLTLHRWRLSAWAGVAAAGLLAFSPLVWRYSVIAEVFSLNQLLVSLLLYLAVAFQVTPADQIARRSRLLTALALVSGLGLANHHTILFVILPVVLWLARDLVRSRLSMRGPAIAFALGLSPYLTLITSAAGHPPFSWGETDTFAGFFAHLLRREFGTFQLGSDSLGSAVGQQGGVFSHLYYYLRSLLEEGIWIGPALAVLALVWARAARASERSFGWLLTGALAFYLLVFGALTNLNVKDPLYFEIQARFWQLPNLLVFLLAGAGLVQLLRRIRAPAWATPLAAVTLLVVQAGLHFRESDQRGNRVLEEFGRKLLEPLPSDSLLLVSSDPGWTATRYVQLALGFRPDVAVLSQNLMSYAWFKPMVQRQYPRLRLPGNQYHIGKALGYVPTGYRSEEYRSGGYGINEFLSANLAQGPVYIEGGFIGLEIPTIQKEFASVPFGLSQRVLRQSEVGLITSGDWGVRARQAKPDFSALARYPRSSWEYFIYTRTK